MERVLILIILEEGSSVIPTNGLIRLTAVLILIILEEGSSAYKSMQSVKNFFTVLILIILEEGSSVVESAGGKPGLPLS